MPPERGAVPRGGGRREVGAATRAAQVLRLQLSTSFSFLHTHTYSRKHSHARTHAPEQVVKYTLRHLFQFSGPSLGNYFSTLSHPPPPLFVLPDHSRQPPHPVLLVLSLGALSFPVRHDEHAPCRVPELSHPCLGFTPDRRLFVVTFFISKWLAAAASSTSLPLSFPFCNSFSLIKVV